MRAFSILWFGQLVSALGSAMTRFAFIIWVWQTTGETTPLALIALFSVVPNIVVSLFAGAVVDRFSRRWIMILGDLGLTLPTIIRLLLLLSGDLQLWHLYVAAAVSGLFAPFQSLAFQASVSALVPKHQLTRANGMLSLNEYVALIGAPVLGGLLLTVANLEAVLVFDILTFFVAVIGVLLIRIPRASTPEHQPPASLLTDAAFGFRYIFARPPLRALLLLLVSFIFFENLGYPLLAPMILARTGENEIVLGTVQGFMGISGLLGGVIITLWGGGRRRVRNILLSMFITGLLGHLLMGLGRSLSLWLVAAVFVECMIPLMLSSFQAIWQSKVPPAVQGRVFAARDLFFSVSEPVPQVFAGILADRVFEPGMQPGGALAPLFSSIVGTGAGAGIALLMILCGVFSALVSVAGYLSRNVRESEHLLPDHDAHTLNP
jgi:MFS family permease